MQSLKPWMNKDGAEKSIEELKRISKSWSPSTWESYLKTLEGGLSEGTFEDPTRVEMFSEEECLEGFRQRPKRYDLKVYSELDRAFYKLSPKQQTVIHSFFYEGKKPSEISQEIGISPNSVNSIKKAALKRLRVILNKSGNGKQMIRSARVAKAS